MTTMRVAAMAGPQRFEIQEIDQPVAPAGGVLLRVRNCGICGSDLHFYRGEFPAMPGLRLGHEIAGEIAAVGDGVEGLAVGQTVAIEPVAVCRRCDFCRRGDRQLCPERKFVGTQLPGGLGEYLALPAYMAHPLPAGVDCEVGALVEPLAVAVHGLRLVGLDAGERVAVIGSGTIGLMSIVAAKALGAAAVVATARYPHQREAAEALGADAVVEANENATQAVREAFGGDAPEVVVESVGGHAGTLNQAIDLVRPGGRVSVLGIYTGPQNVNLTGAVLKEALLIPAITYGSRDGRSDFEIALEIAGRRAEELRRLITHRVALDDVAQGFATAADKSQRSIKVTVALS